MPDSPPTSAPVSVFKWWSVPANVDLLFLTCTDSAEASPCSEPASLRPVNWTRWERAPPYKANDLLHSAYSLLAVRVQVLWVTTSLFPVVTRSLCLKPEILSILHKCSVKTCLKVAFGRSFLNSTFVKAHRCKTAVLLYDFWWEKCTSVSQFIYKEEIQYD